MEYRTLEIDGMSCGHCVGVITKLLQQSDAQARVEVDLPNHTVRVESTAEREMLVAALSQAGYAPA